MRRFAFLAWFVGLWTVMPLPALAADMAVKKTQMIAALPTTDPFTGFGVGVNGGYGFNLGQFGTGPASITDLAGSPQGFVAGVQAFYGTRFNRYLYAGIEGDIDGSAMTGTGSAPGVITATSKNSFLGSVRGRFGFLPMAGNTLIYGTVGWGFGGGQFSITDVVNGAHTTVNPTMSGVVWGGGLEIALDSNWLARAEYLQYDFGNISAAAPTTGILVTQKDRVDVFRGGLSYKF